MKQTLEIVISQYFSDKRLVPGAGAVEVELSQRLAKKAEQVYMSTVFLSIEKGIFFCFETYLDS